MCMYVYLLLYNIKRKDSPRSYIFQNIQTKPLLTNHAFPHKPNAPTLLYLFYESIFISTSFPLTTKNKFLLFLFTPPNLCFITLPKDIQFLLPFHHINSSKTFTFEMHISNISIITNILSLFTNEINNKMKNNNIKYGFGFLNSSSEE